MHKLIASLKANLELEREAELEEDELLRSNLAVMEKTGHGIQRLCLASINLGLVGRTIIRLEFPWKNKPLPPTKMTSGDICAVNFSEIEGPCKGVIRKVAETHLEVVFDKDPPNLQLGETDISVVRLPNDVTYKRCVSALKQIEEHGISEQIRSVLFNASLPERSDRLPCDWIPLDTSLNPSQCEAVAASMSSNPVFLIHGPAATGKTQTVVEVIRQAVLRGERVLVCAPSNIAVDNLVERLVRTKEGSGIIRLGHPARMLDSVLSTCLDARVMRSDVLADIRNDISKTLRTWPKSGKMAKNEYAEAVMLVRQELRILKKELKIRTTKEAIRAIADARIVACTLTGAGELDVWAGRSDSSDWIKFDMVMVDEAAQATEPLTWIAIQHGRKVGLAGDPLQLPPTLKSTKAQHGALGKSLFERAMSIGVKAHLLNIQYRMHRLIMQYSCDKLYGGKLTADASVSSHVLCDLEDVKRVDECSMPLLFIDTDDCGLIESRPSDEYNMSILNSGEGQIVKQHVQTLIKAGVKPCDIGVITPYAAQVTILRELLADYDMEISTVDGFQGREKEAIVLSMVRSNLEKYVGFLADKRRINVSITRARRHLAIIGDRRTVSTDKFMAGLLAHFDKHGEVRSAIEYVADVAVPVSKPPKKEEKKVDVRTKPKKKVIPVSTRADRAARRVDIAEARKPAPPHVIDGDALDEALAAETGMAVGGGMDEDQVSIVVPMRRDGRKNEEEVDMDEILREAQTCGMCNRSVIVMGLACHHCRRKFCPAHAQAEVHGCGKAASQAAAASWMKQQRDSGGVKVSADRRTALAKQLHKKTPSRRKKR